MSQIFFCKGKVFANTFSNSGDGIPGFLLITKELQATQLQDCKLSWIPERDLEPDYAKTLGTIENKLLDSPSVKFPQNINADFMYSTCSFSLALSEIYSIQFKPPHPNKFWWGSCIIHCKSAVNTDVPVLSFHDDICSSTIAKQKKLNKNFDPFSNEGDVYWGGDDLRTCLQSLVDLQKVDSFSYIYLVNASLEDLRNFSLNRFTKVNSESSSSSGKDGKSVWDTLESSRWNIMSKFADATTSASNLFTNLVKRHPIVKIIDKNQDNVYVKQLMKNTRVKEVQDEFDSARIYLAKWAMGVRQEAERYQKEHHLDDTYKRILKSELGISNDVEITPEELNMAVQRSFSLTKQKWDSLFDSQGRLSITVYEVKDFIFHGGIANDELRKEVWLFLLGVYPWDSSLEERQVLRQTLEEDYHANYKSKWIHREPFLDPDEEEYWNDQVFRISKDVRRNDRDYPLYKYNTSDALPPNVDTEENNDNEEGWEIKNPHLLALKNILTSYNIYNSNLGYVQGMTDLLSPIYSVIQDETLSFWCFVNFMTRMERNFLRDQSGIRDQMLTLVDLCQFMLPQFTKHLKKCESSDLFFCFRMLIVWFKREFEFQDVCSIWEIFWTDFYSSQFQLFFMLAILQKHSDVVMSQLTEFDDVLKYFNDLRNSMDWSDIMTRSELLFIKFQKMIDVLEREEELITKSTATTGLQIHELQEEKEDRNNDLQDPPLHHPTLISDNLKQLLSKTVIIQKESTRNKDSVK